MTADTLQPRDPGIYQDVPIEDYHAEPGVSSTMLRLLQHSPREMWAHYINPARPPHRLRAGQLEGQLAHCAVLEPFEFDQRYIVEPVPGGDVPARPALRSINARDPKWHVLEAQRWWAAWDARAAGRVIITAEQRATAMAQAEAVHADPEAAQLLAAGTPELAAYWLDERTGVLCKCRPDWERPVAAGQVFLADLKTFASARPSDVAVQIERKGYWIQDAWYRDGFQAAGGGAVLEFAFIFVEDHYPFHVSVHRLDADSLQAGRRACRELLDLYSQCAAAGDWPGLSGVHTVRLSRRLLGG